MILEEIRGALWLHALRARADQARAAALQVPASAPRPPRTGIRVSVITYKYKCKYLPQVSIGRPGTNSSIQMCIYVHTYT